jgi:phage baseplate assembly protein W
MAQIIANKFPIDLQARKAVGFGFPLNGNAVFVPTYQTKDQIKANLLNYLLTNKGERIFNPNFGSNLRKYLFENINDKTTDDLQYQISNDISLYFPLIEVMNISFDNIPDENTVNFILSYRIKSFGITDQLNILIQ